MITRYLSLELVRSLRNGRYLIFTVVVPSVMFLLFVNLYGGVGQTFPNGLPVVTSLMTNMALFGVMSGPLATGARIAVERGSGWQRQLRLTPLSPGGYVVTKGLLGMLVVLPAIVLVSVIGGVVEGVSLSVGQWALLLGTLWLAALPFVLIGVVIGLVASPDGMQAITGAASLLFGLLGGIWIPAEVAPGWLRTAMEVLPTYWVKQLAQAPLVSGVDVKHALFVLACWVLGLGLVAARRFRATAWVWFMRERGRWWLFSSLFILVYVPGVIWDVAGSGRLPWAKVGLVALLVAYSVGWLMLPMFLWRDVTDGRRLVACLALMVLGLVMVAGLGLQHAGLMVYVMATTAMALPVLWAVLVDGVVLGGLALAMFVTGDLPRDAGELGTLLSVSLGMIALGRMMRANRALEAAQEEMAAMAVSAERARLARDLHDILGHSLTTISLKTGVARRMLESSSAERALEELREIENLSRQALSDVRATVSGYREVSLSAEVVGARSALAAAGVEADLPHAVDNVRPELQGVFGYVLREGVTNVLRHAAATRCSVRLGDTWLEVVDDGRGRGAGAPGSGLAGLTERLAGVGGRLVAGPLDGGGYRLRAEVA